VRAFSIFFISPPYVVIDSANTPAIGRLPELKRMDKLPAPEHKDEAAQPVQDGYQHEVAAGT
jgi:hypothetical protein